MADLRNCGPLPQKCRGGKCRTGKCVGTRQMAPHTTPRGWLCFRLECSFVIADVRPPYLFELHLVENTVLLVVCFYSQCGEGDAEWRRRSLRRRRWWNLTDLWCGFLRQTTWSAVKRSTTPSLTAVWSLLLHILVLFYLFSFFFFGGGVEGISVFRAFLTP